jgi:peptidoglycan glycosyltransferase
VQATLAANRTLHFPRFFARFIDSGYAGRMQALRRWAAMGVALGVIGAIVPMIGKRDTPRIERAPLRKLIDTSKPEPTTPDLQGLELLRLTLHPDRVESPLRHGGSAELTLDPELQRSATSLLSRYDMPEAGVVLMNIKTGDVLAYASRVSGKTPFDVNVRAEAPAASIFKLVTGAALLEQPGITSETEQCYRGGQSRIVADELREDPARDRWCADLSMAMGRSINVVFARLARKLLTPESLTETAGAFGFGSATPFDVKAEVPRADLPADPLEFARAAAGFWHTSLSPLAAASIAQTVANAGVTYRPRIVRAVLEGKEVTWRANPEPTPLRRAMSPRAAHELTKMMVQTVASGSAYKTFHTASGAPYLPHIRVAGKTGTLSRHEDDRHYTWFVGFAPADKPEVAVAALVVNTPVWHIKGPHLGRDVLRAYFARRGYPGVTPP